MSQKLGWADRQLFMNVLHSQTMMAYLCSTSPLKLWQTPIASFISLNDKKKKTKQNKTKQKTKLYYQCEGNYLKWQESLERKKKEVIKKNCWLNSHVIHLLHTVYAVLSLAVAWLQSCKWGRNWMWIYKWPSLFLQVKIIVNIVMNVKPNIGGLTEWEEINTRWNC